MSELTAEVEPHNQQDLVLARHVIYIVEDKKQNEMFKASPVIGSPLPSSWFCDETATEILEEPVSVPKLTTRHLLTSPEWR